ncbi:sucrase ferredoxin [Actinokineospora sp. G85]|uniref:sucrase ferredoxin n=1 Tax=Actinokineospora sp. G85 TaxID=3406626 RepID=UPI003C71FEB0
MTERCAAACTRRGDPQEGTAPPVSTWLLIEQPRAWGPDPWRDCDLPAEVVEGLAERVRGTGTRVLLIRRPGRSTVDGPLRWAFVDSVAGMSWWSTFTDPASLLTAPWRSGVASSEPVYLVCTHGRHDACCAIRGRPVAAALALSHPAETWECSHVGGDRFAANVVALPAGLYFGKVTPESVGEVVSELEAGRLVLEHVRGRSTVSAPAQAAEFHVRGRVGERAVSALAPVSVEALGRDRWRVRLAGVAEGVEVSAGFEEADSPLTCSAGRAGMMRRFRVSS